MTDPLIANWRELAVRWREYASQCVVPSDRAKFLAAAGEREKCADELLQALSTLRACHEEALIAQRLVGHGDGQIQTVEDIAQFVEHLRDEYQSSMEPVKKVARLIRERFGVKL